MPELGVNVDHVATLREARKTIEPDPVAAGLICEKSGVSSIVAHLREDRRHMQDKDIFLLRKKLHIKFNLEMASIPEIVKIAIQIAPSQATIVPERRKEITTEGGLQVLGNAALAKTVSLLKARGIVVSLFIDPIKKEIRQSTKIGADAVELHTGMYANAKTAKKSDIELAKLKDAARFASSLGLIVHAGHGLTYKNAGDIASIPEIKELNIGHSIISRAVFVGLARAVKEMMKLCK